MLTMQNYIERIVIVENKSRDYQSKIVLPDNSMVITIQYGTDVFEIVNERQVPIPKVSIRRPLTKPKKLIFTPGSCSLVLKMRPGTAGFLRTNTLTFSDCNHSVFTYLDQPGIQNLKLPRELDFQKFITDFLNPIFLGKKEDDSVFQAMKIIQKTKGQVKVKSLSYQVCNSKRNLERRFKANTGLTPKQFISHTRFQHALVLLMSGLGLSELSFTGGYCDSSHFINECKTFSGFTPEIILPKLCRVYPMDFVAMPASLHYTNVY